MENRHKKIYLTTGAIAVFAAICLGGVYFRQINKKPTPQVRSIMANESYLIPPKEVSKLSKEALAGSYESAAKLVVFYKMGVSDMERYAYWGRIAAENGATSEYGLILLRNLDSESIFLKKRRNFNDDRAIFWLCRDGGSSLTDQVIKKYDDDKRISLPVSCSRKPLPARLYESDKLTAESDKESLMHNALYGDARASKRLFILAKSESDAAEEKYWLLVSAENGDVASIRRYSDFLMRDGQIERAKFWAMKASGQKN